MSIPLKKNHIFETADKNCIKFKTRHRVLLSASLSKNSYEFQSSSSLLFNFHVSRTKKKLHALYIQKATKLDRAKNLKPFSGLILHLPKLIGPVYETYNPEQQFDVICDLGLRPANSTNLTNSTSQSSSAM